MLQPLDEQAELAQPVAMSAVASPKRKYDMAPRLGFTVAAFKT
jgi:hypothetical protein